MSIPMQRRDTDREFFGHFVADDEPARLDFDRKLGECLRAWHVAWDIAGITEPLDLIGQHVCTAELRLAAQPDGSLDVTVYFRLPAPKTDARSAQLPPAVSYLAQAAHAM